MGLGIAINQLNNPPLFALILLSDVLKSRKYFSF